ncbi:MAG: DUF4345 domain-containing protein, partial [Woeseiaceae bacterium]
MKTNNSRLLAARKLILLLSGLVACGIAVTILFAPDSFYMAYGIELAGNTSLVNELKAPAGVLFVAGLLMLAGVVRERLTSAALQVAATIYLAYGASRFLSFAVDGVPHSALVGAAAFEIAIGAVCLLALLPDRARLNIQT